MARVLFFYLIRLSVVAVQLVFFRATDVFLHIHVRCAEVQEIHTSLR